MVTTKKIARKALPDGIAKVLKRLHYPADVILQCVRWYVAYSLSLRDLEEMIAERGFEVKPASECKLIAPTHCKIAMPLLKQRTQRMRFNRLNSCLSQSLAPFSCFPTR
ncbi:hypothetical protein LMG29542_08413 [Paraburkholderia humisilvae]|uniref:IS6 family transposase ISBmu21 n=1 Tax=Paraburkholderia humisilvae TaxID=627669 RepID=A0A6J5FB51_9BURK|nr:hypothetical protein LMG29542_08413 [Paraburkholderia humisilvae]